MGTPDKSAETEILGRDFLIWLWFKSEINRGVIELGDDTEAEIHFDGKIILQSESDEGVEIVTCSGVNPKLREARFALSEDKKVTQATIKLIMGDDEWSFSMDSTWLNFKSFKTPKIEQDSDDDPDGLFYEKISLLEKAVNTVDSVFSEFIKCRVSEEWENRELPALRRWVGEMRTEI